MTTFFVSDIHFGHRNIIDYCKRPFSQVETMDNALVQEWNKTVNSLDTVYMLGDMAFHNYELIGELKGVKHLIPGNHDWEREKKIRPFIDYWYEEVYYLRIDEAHKFVLCHYPFESWRREYPYHLHGHTHGTAGVKHNRLDVGIDATKIYRPLSLDEVMDHITTNNLWATEMQK